MAGWIGPILAVRLLGRASIYLMTPVSQAFQLAWTNRTMSLAPGQMGSLCVARIRTAECPARPSVQSVAPARRSRGRKLEASAASVAAPVIALLMFFAALGWAGRSRLCREASESPVCAVQQGIGRVCPGTVCRLNGSAAGAWTRRCYSDATQHDRGPRKLGSDQTVDRLALPVRPRGSESSSCAASQNIPAIPTAGTARLAGFIPLIRM
jgi:hypothetical protein